MISENITRNELYQIVYKELGISKNISAEFTDKIFDIVLNQLKNKKFVKISLFGTFKLKQKNERVGRNPKTKEEKKIIARNVVTFKPSKFLLKKINKL